jgi:hypothetical protein
MIAGKYEVQGFMESPMKMMDSLNGDKKQIEVVSDLYASELTEIVNVEKLTLEILNYDYDDQNINATLTKVYSRG